MTSKNLIVYVKTDELIFSYNLQTKEYIECPVSHKYDSPKYFDKFETFFNLQEVKAFIFAFFELSPSAAEHDFRRRCKEFCEKHGIFYYFSFYDHMCASVAISSTKTIVKEGEHILLIFSTILRRIFRYTILIREKNCYRIVKMDSSTDSPFTQQWKNSLFGNYNPKKIIFVQIKIFDDHDSTEEMKAFFKNESFDTYILQMFNDDDEDPTFLQTVDQVLHLMGEKIDIYDIRPSCLLFSEVTVDGRSLIKTSFTDATPFEKSVIVEVYRKYSIDLCCTYETSKHPEIVEEIKLSTFKSKKVKVTLKLDINSFYDFKVEPFDESKMDETKSKLTDKATGGPKSDITDAGSTSDKHVEPDKAQMVFEKQHFSVSYFANGKEYNLNDSDGLNKTPIYISFHEKKPIVGKTAMKLYSEKPKFVVFDLIKLCSVSTDDIINPKWGFRLSKESESLIVTMETFDDEKKSTVEFLLAIILKEGKDRIKKETGKRMEEMEIKFDGFSPNEILKKNFIEAGKLLKINILFV